MANFAAVSGVGVLPSPLTGMGLAVYNYRNETTVLVDFRQIDDARKTAWPVSSKKTTFPKSP